MSRSFSSAVRLLCGVSFVAVLLLLSQQRAQAYPQWQFTSGTTRCNQCHFNPAGGGLLRGYGRDAAGEELSTFEGNGNFLHGAVDLPDWLALGGDFRGAFVRQDVQGPDSPQQAVFPMQADVYGRVALGDSFSVQATVGARGQVRKSGEIPPGNFDPANAHRVVSREHFVMWQPAAQGWYARGGRFYAPFGLRLAEHITYIRRDLGFNLLEESYNLSGGYISNAWELHLTAFGPDFAQRLGARETGGAVYAERRLFEETGSIAVQAKYGTVDGNGRLIGGLVARYFLAPAKLMFLAEGNVVNQQYGPAVQNQLVGAAGFTFVPWNSLFFTALAERSQTSIQVKDSATDALSGFLNWFPYPHTEVQLVGRLQKPAGIETATTLFVQLHYWL